MAFYTLLPDRALLSVSGPDRFSFLQGLISNDMQKVESGGAMWAALLTPQGKFLHEFFVFSIGDEVVLDCEDKRRDDLLARLSRYKLRSQVDLRICNDLVPGAAWKQDAVDALNLSIQAPTLIINDGIAYLDTRLTDAGARWALSPNAVKSTMNTAGLSPSTPEDYDTYRLSLGLPDGSRDMEIEKALLLENSFEELNGVDFQKGCYMGQEITARTHYRALIKKRLLPVDLSAESLESGTLLESNGTIVGEMKSSREHKGMALIKLYAWEKAGGSSLVVNNTSVTPYIPSWMKLSSATKLESS